MKLVLFNAPPRSGKNTAATFVFNEYPHLTSVIGFSHHLKRMVHAVYLGRRGWDMDPDAFDAIKGEPQEILGGKSWRQMYIHYSENVVKPMHGKEWFGDRFMQTAHDSGSELIAVPDSGFYDEALRCVREVGPENVRLIRLHKEGCTFAGDSRSYIDLAPLGVQCFDVDNVHGDPTIMRWAINEIVADFVDSSLT